jgi:hypothetical protein
LGGEATVQRDITYCEPSQPKSDTEQQRQYRADDGRIGDVSENTDPRHEDREDYERLSRRALSELAHRRW